MLDKKSLAERDICTKFITPAIVKAGLDTTTQFLEEVSFTDGKIYVRGKLHSRGRAKWAYYKPNNPIPLVEAKDNKHTIGAGLQQALDYSQILDIPFVFGREGLNAQLSALTTMLSSGLISDAVYEELVTEVDHALEITTSSPEPPASDHTQQAA